MSYGEIAGLIEAVEAESRQPGPSHSNLARLLATFMRLTVEEMYALNPSVVPHPEDPIPFYEPMTMDALSSDVPPEPVKVKKRKAKGK